MSKSPFLKVKPLSTFAIASLYSFSASSGLSLILFCSFIKDNTNFESDKRIKFIGSVYDQDELKTFRELAYAYLHGHSAGGTNPSLLEALSTTKVNILYDVAYNKEVGLDSCFYFNKDEDNLKKVLEKVDKLSKNECLEYERMAKKRIKDDYTWQLVVLKYQELFEKILGIKS